MSKVARVLLSLAGLLGVSTHALAAEFRVVTGSYAGDGTAARPITGIGFRPDFVIVKGASAAVGVARTGTMTGNASKDLAGDVALVAGRITSLDADGFTLGADASVNANGTSYTWTAFLSGTGQMKVGTYSGNNVDNRNITGLGFQPGHVMILGENARLPVQRFSAETGLSSTSFQAEGEFTNRIQALQADGFQVGTSTSVNSPGVRYHYVAWNAASPQLRTGSYTGDGLDARVLAGVGFRPEWVLIKRPDSLDAVARFDSSSADLTAPLAAAASFAGGIEALGPDGFRVGTDRRVNAAGRTFFWAAFDDARTDLEVSSGLSRATANENDAVTWAVEVANRGPGGATGIMLAAAMPAGLTRVSHVASLGTYDPLTGAWTVGAVANGDSATLTIQASVDAGTAGMLVMSPASISSVVELDPNPSNDQASDTLRVRAADLDLRTSVDLATPTEGDTVSFQVRLRNDGPDTATSVTVMNQLPSTYDLTSSQADRGGFASGSGLWTVGTLAPADSATLVLRVALPAGTGGGMGYDVASVASAEGDPTALDRTDSTAVTVVSASTVLLQASQQTRAARPGDVGVELLALTVTNTSSASLTLDRLVVTNRTSGPGTLADRDAEIAPLRLHRDDGDGVYLAGSDSLVMSVVPVSGAVVFPGLARLLLPGARVRYFAVVDLPLGARDGDILDLSLDGPNRALFDRFVTFQNAWPLDPAGAITVDGLSSAQIAIHPVAAAAVEPGTIRRLTLDWSLPPNGYEADELNEVHLSNIGDAAATDVRRVEVWGDGGDGGFDAGSGDDLRLGIAAWDGARWSITGLTFPIPLAGHRFYASLDLADSARTGRTLEFSLTATGAPAIVMASGNDGPVDAPATNPNLLTIQPVHNVIEVSALPESARTLLPGLAGSEVLRLKVVNRSARPETLVSLVVTNQTVGAGNAAQLDADWMGLTLSETGGSVLATASFTAGRASFGPFTRPLAAGDSVVVTVSSGASLGARDGDRLGLGVTSSGDIGFGRAVELEGAWPLEAGGPFEVDGMAVAQIGVLNGNLADLITGSSRNLVLALRVPANGYQPDTLQFLLLRNLGDALPGTDIARVEVWADDGDNVFESNTGDANADRLLGVMGDAGGGWALAGFALPVPASGQRVFISCDVAPEAIEGRTLRLALPAFPVAGIGMASGNDGPRDAEAAGSLTMTIATVSRIVLTPLALAAGTVHPGDRGVTLLAVSVHNTYADSTRVLRGLTLTNLTSGHPGATQDDLDAEMQSLLLRQGSPVGPVLAGGFFSLGKGQLGGLSLPIPPQGTVDLFVTADLSVDGAADGDVLGAAIETQAELDFSEPTSLSAHFPVGSSAAWTVDGMTSAQIIDLAGRGSTLGPNDGPALALDWVVPRNGYVTDVLEGVRLVNTGTATAAELREMRLWKDGGNGVFDVGAVDDIDLGPMTLSAGKWVSRALSEPVQVGGLRVYASVATSATPLDSSIIRLGIPVDGIVMGSDDDGPIDSTLVGRTTVVLSTSHLLASLALNKVASVMGDTVVAQLLVRNVGAQAINNIVPASPTAGGDGVFTPLGPIAPASLSLPAGGQGTFVWLLRSDGAGLAELASGVSGTESGTGALQRSLAVSTGPHRIFSRARDLGFFPVASSPATVMRGQRRIAPFTLSFSNAGGGDVADVLLERLKFRLEDENGNAVVPSRLVSRISLSQGPTTYYQTTALATSGSTVDLTLTRPIRVQGGGFNGGQVTLGMSLDVSDTTLVQSFRLVIDDSTSFLAEDAISRGPVAIALDAGLAYPISSGLTRVLAGASELDFAANPDTARSAGRGQDDVPLLGLELLNPSPLSLGPDVRLSAFGVRLLDAYGAVIQDPETVLQRIRVRRGSATLLDRPVTSADGPVVTLAFLSTVAVPINTLVGLTLSADIGDSAVTGVVRLALADSAAVAAVNASTGASLPAVYAARPLAGAPVRIQEVADSMRAMARAGLPATLTVGSSDVAAMTITLRHPGGTESSWIRLDRLDLQCRDQSGASLSPAQFVDRARVLMGGAEVGLVTNAPTAAGPFAVSIAGVAIAPGASVELEVRFGVEATAPTGLFELMVPANGFAAEDVNLGTTVAVAPDSGAGFPLSSGITRLVPPPRELAAGFADRMPAVMVADGGSVPVATLSLRNTAGTGQIFVDRLSLVAGDRVRASLPAGDVVSSMAAYVADTLWAETGAVAAGTMVADLMAASPLAIDPDTAITIELRMTLRAGTVPDGWRLGCRSDGIGIVQPASSVLSVGVLAEQGQTFPFWTEAAGLATASLKDSYSNFPNPFAAGRSQSRFAFYLRTSAKVTLTLWTVRGDRVTTLLDQAAMSGGLHQEVGWDGRNRRGEVVTNGAYVAELRVAYDDGASEREVRKVAVVR